MDQLSVKNLTRTIIHKSSSNRFIEIDMTRGGAIILMIFAHVLWDMDYYGIMPINSTFYSILQKTVAPVFFILVGISLMVSKKKMESSVFKNEKSFYNGIILRGLKIFGLGMILTIVSFLVIPDKPVFFGVLHCIGLSVILSAFLLKYRKYTLLFAFLILFIGFLISDYSVEAPTILHLVIGLHQSNIWMHTVDYFPLIPWFGIILIGIVLGDILYCGNDRRFHMPDLSKYKPVKIFQWFGRHSLIIYLIHQPIIAGVLFVFMLL